MTWKEDCLKIHYYFTADKPWDSNDHLDFLALGLAGEAGEVANVQKKAMRGDNLPNYNKMISDEMADVMMYLYMMSDRLGIDLDIACEEKCKELKERWPYVWE